MTIDQVVNELKEEMNKKLTSRFLCRAIMVRSLGSYRELLKKLREELKIETISSEILFSGSDVMPRYESLTASAYETHWMILPGVSEYLRLFWRNEAETQRFAKLWSHQSPSSSTGRIIIPLWGCEPQWFDNSLHLADDIRQNDFYYDCISTDDTVQQLKYVVFANSFSEYANVLVSESLRYDSIFCGLREWYDYWASPSTAHTNLALMTARYRYVKPVNGNISINVIQDTLSFIKENLVRGEALTVDNCPSEAQECLFEKALHGDTIEEAILSCLNMGSFAPYDVMSRWKVLSTGQKQLILLWYHLHNDGSYLCHCILGSKDPSDVEKRVLREIFRTYKVNPDWIVESQNLLDVMNLVRDDEYFGELNNLPDYKERLDYLSCKTEKERSYLLHMVGLWMREDEEEVLKSSKLKAIYPSLEAYLNGDVYDEDLQRYMKLYKTYKLSNTLPEDEESYFSGIQIDTYDYRYTILSDVLNDDSIILWVDALGVEWMPLLLWTLSHSSAGSVQMASIGQANLPAETEFNMQWKKMDVPHKKLDKLDKLAHKGIVDDPNYYSCVEEQIEFVAGLSKKAEELISQYHRIIITGDHGASRLAARFFHKRDGIPLAKDWKAFNHGRYAMVTSIPPSLLDVQIPAKDDNGNLFLVFKNYDHFVQSGFAAGSNDDVPIYGEVHGGASPEEALVPIIVFDSIKPLAINAKWKDSTVKIKNKKVKAVLCFNQPIHQLDARVGSNTAIVFPSHDRKEWTVSFSGLKEGKYSVNIAADGKLISIDKITVLPALGNPDGDIL